MTVEWLTVTESETRLGGLPALNVEASWRKHYFDMWVDGRPRGWVRRGDVLFQGDSYTAWVWHKGSGSMLKTQVWEKTFDDLDDAKDWARYKWSEVKETYDAHQS